jgi:predicted AlkP superfamily phosphohydrolase/phosphomutase/tetratricopeptide (TPR) repeat protein
MPNPRVMLIGWDAADWKVIRPLLQAGEMPNLARLIASGVHGNLATIYPPLSPMLWTSIATGKRAYKHGIHGFTEPLPDGSGVRPITLLSRKTKAVWNILNQTGHRSIVVGWWPSHPAEPINGVMISNHFEHALSEPNSTPPLPPGAVHPISLAPSLADLRVNPTELTGEFLRFFVPEYDKVDQAKDKRLHSLAKIIAETMSVQGAATELLATQPWDFAAIYYSGIDHFGHGFMRYHPPQLPWVSDGDFAIYQHVIANAYRYHDAMLGALLAHADENTTVILMSDHGFHPDHLRPGYIPAEPAGPAVEHRHFGIVCMKGPSLRVDEQLFGASLLDICPTILTLFGLPPGKDMDGKVLLTAFREQPPVEPIESWDKVSGDAGTHPAETQLDPVASAEAFKQLVELGYVAPPGPNEKENVDECVRELKYNLARAYRDGNCCGEAAALAEELWTRWPKEHRFGILLIECLAPLRQLDRRRAAIEEFCRRIERFQAEAKAELARREAEKGCGEIQVGARAVPGSQQTQLQGDDPIHSTPADPAKVLRAGDGSRSGGEGRPALRSAFDEGGREGEGGVLQPASPEQDTPDKRRAQFVERQLRELAHGRPLLIEWFLASQFLLEKRPAEARPFLEKVAAADSMDNDLGQRVAAALVELGEMDEARELLESALDNDPENALVHAQLAGIHFRSRRFDEAIASAVESLSLLYFQPGLHALLGQALIETKRFDDAERELLVAVSQSPRHIVAHELLAKLYRDHLNRPADAFAHEGRARSLRHEMSTLKRDAVQVDGPAPALATAFDEASSRSGETESKSPQGENPNGIPPSSPGLRGTSYPGLQSAKSPSTLKGLRRANTFAPEVDPSQIITIVSGLPRSGTSLMMQLLVAAGREALTDSKRAADEDNPLGYFEFEKSIELARDTSWLQQARGKVVKIVAQLLPHLPANEHYQIVFMERDLAEVIASQKAMLTRQSRRGAELDEQKLRDIYSSQLNRVQTQLARRSKMRMLKVSYSDLVADPMTQVSALAEFLGAPFDFQAAANAVRPELQRQKAVPEAG